MPSSVTSHRRHCTRTPRPRSDRPDRSCVSQRQLGVITGEVGAGETVAIRAALGDWNHPGIKSLYSRPHHRDARHPIPDRDRPWRNPAFIFGVLATQSAGLPAGNSTNAPACP